LKALAAKRKKQAEMLKMLAEVADSLKTEGGKP